MKKSTFLILTLVFYYNVFSQGYQPLIRQNTYWDVHHVESSQICNLSGGDRYFFSGDTILQGKNYKIIKSHPIVNLLPGPYCPPFAIDVDSITPLYHYMREDTTNRKVYVYDQGGNESDALLYDFALSVGDTLPYYAGQGITLIVDSIKPITLLNSTISKIWYLNNNEYYIEGIGGSQGLWFPLIQGIGFCQELLCVQENNIQLWGNTCFGTTNISEEKNENKIKVFPNPANNYLWIERYKETSETLQIVNILGETVLNYIVILQKEKINISSLKSGFYLLKISDGLESKMIIINNGL